jgi:hypothetical protein
VDKYCTAGQATDDNMAHAHDILDTLGYKHKILYFVDRSSRYKFLVINKLDALLHIFIYLFHLSTCFERNSAHHQEVELY